MANPQLRISQLLASDFLNDFLQFLNYFKIHQVRVTTQHRHIPLRHLQDLAKKLQGKEPFHPLHTDAAYEMRCQRDERRIDFMDLIASHLQLLERSEWGYIVTGLAFSRFRNLPPLEQEREILDAFWTMDWSPLYPWAEVVDCLQAQRQAIRDELTQYPAGKKIPVMKIAEKFLRQGKTGLSERERDGFFWVIIRPLEYLGLAVGHFAKDIEGFYFPDGFELSELSLKLYARPNNFPP